jgi:hypothetical protein
MNYINSHIPALLVKELLTLPNQAGVRSLINQTCFGEVFPKHPDKYVLLKSMDAYCYLAGELDENDVTDLMQFLNTFPSIKLVCDERHHAPLLLRGLTLCARVDLVYKGASTYIATSPSLTIKQISTPEFGKDCPWFDFVTGLYGSDDIFLKNGFGFAVCEGETVLSSSYAACIGDNHCEIAIATAPEHEGKGMATFAVNACVQECLKRDLIPEWSCNANHPASLRVALKSGFVVKRYYAFLELKGILPQH